jgi:hypothetical protein
MLGETDLVVAGLTLLGGGAVGLAVGGVAGGLFGWAGERLHVAMMLAMAAGAGLALVFGDTGPAPGYEAAAQLKARELGLASDGRDAAVLAVLRAYYPADHARVLAVLSAKARAHASPAEMDHAFDRALIPVMARELPFADTGNTVAALKLARREQQAMQIDPRACYRAMRTPGGALPISGADLGLQNDERRLAARLLVQTALEPQVPRLAPDMADRLHRLAGATAADLPSGERRALTAAAGAPGYTRAVASCDFGARLFDTLLLAPPDQAARLFKGLAARGGVGVGERLVRSLD